MNTITFLLANKSDENVFLVSYNFTYTASRILKIKNVFPFTKKREKKRTFFSYKGYPTPVRKIF